MSVTSRPIVSFDFTAPRVRLRRVLPLGAVAFSIPDGFVLLNFGLGEAP